MRHMELNRKMRSEKEDELVYANIMEIVLSHNNKTIESQIM